MTPARALNKIYETTSLPALSSGTLSDDSSGSNLQFNATNTHSNDENDRMLFPKGSNGLVTPNLDTDSLFDKFLNTADV